MAGGVPQTIKWRDVSGGVVQKVSPDIAIPNSVPFSMNLIYDKVLGEAFSRPGTALLRSVSSGDCQGLFQHVDSTPANSKMFSGFGGTIFDAVNGTSLATGLDGSAKMRFATFMNTTLMLNGVTPRSYTAAGGWITTGGTFDLANIPSSAQYPIEYKDRMYCAVTDRLYYTTTPATAAATTVSWTAAGSGSIQVENQDGGGTVTGLNKVPGYLMIYKQRSLKRWNFDSTFPEDLVNIGTQSHESIVRARGKNFFFYGPNGFYQTDGGYPTIISRPIQRIVEGISSSFFSKINGWSDNVNIYWSVGDITVDFDRGYTETYTNVVLRYTIDTQQWAPLKYANRFLAMTQYISGNDTLIGCADNAGKFIQLNSGTTDLGSPITYLLQSPEFDFGVVLRLTGAFINQREFLKTLSEKIFVHSDLTSGAQILRRLDYGDWKAFGTLGDIVTEVPISNPMIAHVFEFRITDSITGTPIKFRGMNFPNIDIHQQSK